MKKFNQFQAWLTQDRAILVASSKSEQVTAGLSVENYRVLENH